MPFVVTFEIETDKKVIVLSTFYGLSFAVNHFIYQMEVLSIRLTNWKRNLLAHSDSRYFISFKFGVFVPRAFSSSSVQLRLKFAKCRTASTYN